VVLQRWGLPCWLSCSLKAVRIARGHRFLGHVGMVIAGIIAAFLGIFVVASFLFCASHVKAYRKCQQADPERRNTE